MPLLFPYGSVSLSFVEEIRSSVDDWLHDLLDYFLFPLVLNISAGVKLGGDLGEIIALGSEISPLNGLREKWESPLKKKKKKIFFFFLEFSSNHSTNKL